MRTKDPTLDGAEIRLLRRLLLTTTVEFGECTFDVPAGQVELVSDSVQLVGVLEPLFTPEVRSTLGVSMQDVRLPPCACRHLPEATFTLLRWGAWLRRLEDVVPRAREAPGGVRRHRVQFGDRALDVLLGLGF
ncbi:hypothetical protein [Actinopolymorpha pittospori]|uniref:hypothetical protein n=1 Tax=Actinopolymorpha pittospori TaxID=648752 RepID=UPI003CD0703E